MRKEIKMDEKLKKIREKIRRDVQPLKEKLANLKFQFSTEYKKIKRD